MNKSKKTLLHNKGINTGTDDDATGTLYERSELGTGGSSVLFK